MSWPWHAPHFPAPGLQNVPVRSANNVRSHGVPPSAAPPPPPPQFDEQSPGLTFDVASYQTQMYNQNSSNFQNSMHPHAFGMLQPGCSPGAIPNPFALQQYHYSQQGARTFPHVQQFQNPYHQQLSSQVWHHSGAYGGARHQRHHRWTADHNHGRERDASADFSRQRRGGASRAFQRGSAPLSSACQKAAPSSSVRQFGPSNTRPQGETRLEDTNEPPKQENRVKAELEIARQEIQKLGATLPGDSPEELEKWIAERRARWPSKANVERKRQEELARAERGEIDLKKQPASLRAHVTGKVPGVPLTRGAKRSGPRTTDGKSRKLGKTSVLTLDSSAAARIAESKNACDNLVSTSALGALANQYAGGSSDEGEADPEEGQIIESEQRAHAVLDAGTSKAKDRGDSRRGQRQRKRKGRRGVDSKIKHVPVPEAKPTLLRKLLEPEIREEQNVILQCIRILVREEFFVEEQEAPIPSGAE